MTWAIVSWTMLALLILAAMHSGVALLLALRRNMLLIRRERRLKSARCPECDYPLRFNQREHWCSECGYRHPLQTDSAPD